MLSHVVADVTADFVTQGVTALIYIGKDYIAQEGKADRVVFVPTTDEIGPTKRVGGNPRSILNRAAGAEVHVWGSTVALTEALINQTLLSLHRATYGSYRIGKAGWNNTINTVEYGSEYVFQVEIDIPVTDVPWAVVMGVLSNTTSKLIYAGGEFVGCSGG